MPVYHNIEVRVRFKDTMMAIMINESAGLGNWVLLPHTVDYAMISKSGLQTKKRGSKRNGY